MLCLVELNSKDMNSFYPYLCSLYISATSPSNVPLSLPPTTRRSDVDIQGNWESASGEDRSPRLRERSLLSHLMSITSGDVDVETLSQIPGKQKPTLHLYTSDLEI